MGRYIQWTGYGVASNISLHGVFSDDTPMHLPACAASDFQLWHAAPVFDNGIAFLGEPEKWVPIAERRVISVSADASDVTVELSGDAGEAVELAFAMPDEGGVGVVHSLQCVLSDLGRARAIFNVSAGGSCEGSIMSVLV